MKHLGIDVHLKATEICELCEKGEVVRRDRIPTTATGYRRYFGRRKPRKIVMESGPSTPWVYRLLTELGHEVLVLDPRKIRLIAESTLKCDRTDAEILARLCRMDEALLQPVYQRRYISQELRTRLKARQSLVRARAKLMTAVRGCLRAHGYRMRSCAAKGFVSVWAETPVLDGLRDALDPLVETIYELTERILALEKALHAEAKGDELLERLQEIPGVGPLVALAFSGWVDQPGRFATSRDVGASLGLRPRLRSSGERTYRGKITRSGDREMRWLLVQGAHASFLSKRDTALKRWASQLEKRAGKSKAVIATARKMAVLMHRMWVTGAHYEPFPQTS